MCGDIVSNQLLNAKCKSPESCEWKMRVNILPSWMTRCCSFLFRCDSRAAGWRAVRFVGRGNPREFLICLWLRLTIDAMVLCTCQVWLRFALSRWNCFDIFRGCFFTLIKFDIWRLKAKWKIVRSSEPLLGTLKCRWSCEKLIKVEFTIERMWLSTVRSCKCRNCDCKMQL